MYRDAKSPTIKPPRRDDFDAVVSTVNLLVGGPGFGSPVEKDWGYDFCIFTDLYWWEAGPGYTTVKMPRRKRLAMGVI
ncbi:jg24931 [Pararge aegeria aegeria]|uniref:Jg24931 protein n=1 Tax=Pararge aegeria aegeria TaxID=348720 RepID=A0A8S4QZC9_9NEOP|nr:jg24931 [Pararge aegeria aegeria]